MPLNSQVRGSTKGGYTGEERAAKQAPDPREHGGRGRDSFGGEGGVSRREKKEGPKPLFSVEAVGSTQWVGAPVTLWVALYRTVSVLPVLVLT